MEETPTRLLLLPLTGTILRARLSIVFAPKAMHYGFPWRRRMLVLEARRSHVATSVPDSATQR
jgi:hypothetical protein